MPPLRERADDAVVLARAFLERICRRYGVGTRRLGPDAERAVRAYGWPGNVRELANTLERAVLFSDAERLEPADLGLPTEPGAPGVVQAGPSGEVRIDIPESGLSLEAVERALLAGALAKAGGNQSGAARLLGISRDTLRYRMEKYGLSGE